MSVGIGIVAPAGAGRLGLRLGLMALAIGLAALLAAGIAWLVAPGLSAPPPRSPFGIGFREAAPSATGIGGVILALQASFSRSLNAAVGALRGGGSWGPLVGLAFAYGVFHAAGPGHGKAVIAGYILAGERALRRGAALSLCAALLQACMAGAIVGLGTLVLNATAASITRAGTLIETVSFALVALIGLVLTWRKAGRLATLGAGCGPGCNHLPGPQALDTLDTWRERAGVVLAAGTRPCAGAVLVLVFAVSQGVPGAGVLAVLAMALGTALTTTALACLAVFAKRAALRLAGGRGQAGLLALGGLELVAAAFVLVLGAAMLSGLAPGLGG
ncbi:MULTISPECIES: nickel transporter [Methylobacterium]|uniref:Nickel/cobalt efflux system n=2 Tax=Methylobacterium TaxID=407 RepID=A0AAE8L7F8_9HYPH|nr:MULTISPECIES: nickel transporter [Methylobacterium]APT31146.1 putative nickel/cobalt efflux system [Methylobacterium phyllosphaerae]AWV17422.1 nickel transporter [Methylobacterium sp. XJLW]WFS10148.1 nickel transporter [Methylobacterium sp. 391_Methyba4]SFH12785.1 nickel/cobalt exporter [Methylobacterium phyllosphaerae]SFU89442.1 nickel/cobalt exporter [Methylobacterium sp. UNCCL125]